MPEGDTIFRAARTLHAALAGQVLTRFDTGLAQLADVDRVSRAELRTKNRTTGAWKRRLRAATRGVLRSTLFVDGRRLEHKGEDRGEFGGEMRREGLGDASTTGMIDEGIELILQMTARDGDTGRRDLASQTAVADLQGCCSRRCTRGAKCVSADRGGACDKAAADAPRTFDESPAEISDTAATRHDAKPQRNDLLTIPEGNILETVLTNRLDGGATSPVNCLVTTPLYASNGQIVIPAGARVLGQTKTVQAFGEARLAVAFHRLLMPNGETHALEQLPGPIKAAISACATAVLYLVDSWSGSSMGHCWCPVFSNELFKECSRWPRKTRTSEPKSSPSRTRGASEVANRLQSV